MTLATHPVAVAHAEVSEGPKKNMDIHEDARKVSEQSKAWHYRALIWIRKFVKTGLR
ncbi:hypothetical protein [Phyllobacterium sp. SB3]|uniref:hypothetical protein n=1 Tax=Phyllobacterium sp. SB3 TaxID=3156073 RepID=UPI0032AFDC6E